MAEAINWKNFTDEDFTWKFNGDPYTFKAGQEIFLEDYKAAHFTKHLVDRELNKLGKPTNDPLRASLEQKCVGGEIVTPEVALDLNEKAKKVKKVVKEEEFPDLKAKGKKV